MNQGKYVFSQIAEFLPNHDFDACVERYNGNSYIKHFACWNQLLCMMFGQLGNCDSLSNLTLVIQAHQSKVYHLGFGKNVSKNNLAKANENRDWRIFADFSTILIAQARKCCLPNENFDLAIEGNVYAFDATVIDLCLNIFWWAKYKTTKGAIKVNTLFDVKTSIPCFIHITEAAIHDVNAMDELTYEKDSFYVFDRAYIDFTRLYRIHIEMAFFVIRAKKNFTFKRMYSHKCNKSKGVRCDQTVVLTGFYSAKEYPDKLRRIKYYDEKTDTLFVFLTNNLELTALEIALLYKYRWQVELFFKWIKSHLKIKTFWGYSENAVRIQIYIAIITYTLVAIVKAKLNSPITNYEILQILNLSLLDKTPVTELINSPDLQNVKEPFYNQLKLF
jgi:transposase